MRTERMYVLCLESLAVKLFQSKLKLQRLINYPIRRLRQVQSVVLDLQTDGRADVRVKEAILTGTPHGCKCP